MSKLVDKIIFDFHDYLLIKDTIDQLTFSLNLIENTLTELENSVTFSHLNALNFKIVNIKDMMTIIEQAKNIYGIEYLPFPTELNYLMNYYEISETASYFSNNRITFLIKVPIVLPHSFNYFHLYSIPNINQTTIITKSLSF